MRSIWIAIVAVLWLYSCGETPEPAIEADLTEQTDETSDTVHVSDMNDSLATVRSTTNTRYSIVPLFDAEAGWGYDILDSNKLLIHQPHIPVVQGIRGFKSKSDAIKVAQTVLTKLQMGVMPPTLSEEEMKALGVL